MDGKKYVKITKLDVAEHAANPTANEENWIYGQPNSDSPFVGYVAEGFLLREIEVGKPIMLDRRVRNGVEVVGNFTTSTVLAFDGKVATTRNSKYLVEYRT